MSDQTTLLPERATIPTDTKETNSMRIIELKAENIKRLVAIDIRPSGDVVTLTGKNGAGKSSVLDAIWWALAGERNIQDQPVRQGEKAATVRVDLDGIVVERRFNAGGTSRLTVESKDGAVFRSPQAMLDSMLGALAFDPLEFVSLKPAEKIKMLRAALTTDVDFDALEARRTDLYRERTEVNRDHKREAAQADEYRDIPPDLPAKPVNLDQVIADGQDARAHNAKIEAAAETVSDLARQIADLEQSLTDAKRRHAEQLAIASQPLKDLSALQDAYQRGKTANDAIRRRDVRDTHRRAADEARRKSDALTAEIEGIDATKADAIAKAALPVDGLSWSGDAITLGGVPLDQVSTGEQLRIGVALAMALNPKIRVLRIKEGSLLDDDNLALIRGLAKQHDFQVWIETVRSDDPLAILIEEGAVAGAKAA